MENNTEEQTTTTSTEKEKPEQAGVSVSVELSNGIDTITKEINLLTLSDRDFILLAQYQQLEKLNNQMEEYIEYFNGREFCGMA